MLSTANIVAQDADGSRLKDSLFQLAEVKYYESFDSAMFYFYKIMDMAKRNNRYEEYLEVLYNLSWCAEYHKRMNEFRSYIELGNRCMQDHAKDLQKWDPNFIHRASMMNAKGLYFFSISDYPQAVEEYSKIISLTTKPIVNDSVLIRSTCTYIGQAYYQMGNFDLSAQYFDLGHKYLDPNDPEYDYQQAMDVMYQGQNALALKQYRQASAFYMKALMLMTQQEYRPRIRNGVRSAYHVLARCYTETGKFDSALLFVKKSLPYHIVNDQYYVNTHLLLGNIFHRLKKYDSATSHYTKALEMTEHFYKGSHFNKAIALRGLGDVSASQEHFEKARGFYHRAITQVSGNDTYGKNMNSSPQESLKILIGQAKLYYHQSRRDNQPSFLDSCILAIKQGISLIDDLRKQLINLETKEFIANEAAELYSLGVNAAYDAFRLKGQKGSLEDVFFFIEKSKSNVLLDKALDARARMFAGIPDKILDQEKELLGTLSVFQKQLLKNREENVQQQYLATQREYLKFISDLEKQYPRYHNLKYNTQVTRIESLRLSLSPGEALVEYFVTDTIIYVLGIDNARTVIQAVHWNSSLKKSMEDLRSMISNPAGAEITNSKESYTTFIRNSHYLFQHILAPVLKNLKAKELTIIADGKLCYIPFELLLTTPVNTGSAVEYSQLPYLLRDFEIKYAYSASLTLERARARKGYEYAFLGFAPSYRKTLSRKVNEALIPLPNNQHEIREAAKLWDGKLFLDSVASETAFKQNSLSANILHLATHTIIDDMESTNSGIALSSEANDDGFLYTYELYSMEMNADLAILSGCETGVGPETRGEGMRSLARAFRYAGCNSIVMSLWKANDKTTRDIMTEFHKNLRSGMEKDQALRMAKLAYLKGSPLNNPFYWSAFVLVGDDEPLDFGGNILLVVTIAFSFILLAFFARKKIRRLSLFNYNNHL